MQPENKQSATTNLIDLATNIAIIQGLCGGVNASEAIRRNGNNPNVTSQIIREAKLESNKFQSDILGGEKPWIVRIKRVIPASAA